MNENKEIEEMAKVKDKEKHWLETCMSIWKNAKIDAREEMAEEILTDMFSVINQSKSAIQWDKEDVKAFIVSFAKAYKVNIEE